MLEFGTEFAQITLAAAILVAVFRLVKGPSLPDRVVAMDLIGILAVGLIVVLAASTHLSCNAPNALVQESVRSFYTGWYKELVTGLPEVKDGMIAPPPGPGLGMDLLPDLMKRKDAVVRVSAPE